MLGFRNEVGNMSNWTLRKARRRLRHSKHDFIVNVWSARINTQNPYYSVWMKGQEPDSHTIYHCMELAIKHVEKGHSISRRWFDQIQGIIQDE